MRMNSLCCAKVPQPAPVPMNTPMSVAEYMHAHMFVTSAANVKCQPKKEETPMDMESNQRNYLEHRIDSVVREKVSDLRRSFGLEDNKPPSSTEEFIARIKAGEYILRGDADEYGYLEFTRIRWRTPDMVKDQAGFDAASKRVTDARTELLDKARLYPIADATKAFEEFKTADFAVG